MAGVRVHAWVNADSASRPSGQMVSAKEVLQEIVGLLASSQISGAIYTLNSLISKEATDKPLIEAAEWDAVCEMSRSQSVAVEDVKKHAWRLLPRYNSRSAEHRSEQASRTGRRTSSLFGTVLCSASTGAARSSKPVRSGLCKSSKERSSRCDSEKVEQFSVVLPDQIRCRTPEDVGMMSRYRDGTKADPADVETPARDRSDVPHAPVDRSEEEESNVFDGWRRLPLLKFG
eukprot:TRINITY_DN38986_c0_g1_i1.p1 TRINITY_DN38986_c0_g1~~TRINITY_DN38986_c0_g1_i1.p1  ORF type:complete len:248 (-),score=37.46 TRINITY_DN38986_c0_g1_i1:191-883(-)